MNERIGKLQLNKLTEKQKVRLNDMWGPNPLDKIVVGDVTTYVMGVTIIDGEEILMCGDNKQFKKKQALPLLSIGQMIDILRKLNYNFSGDWGNILLRQNVVSCLYDCVCYIL